jgi:hypothetical protein
VTQLKTHQQTIDSQYVKIQELQKDRARLKGFVVRYEAELRQLEEQQQQGAGQSQHRAGRDLQQSQLLSPGDQQQFESHHHQQINVSHAASFVVERAQ